LFSGKIGEGLKNKQRIKRELLDELLKDYKSPEDILERALGAELTRHLGYERHDPTGYGSGNSRNGTTEHKKLDTTAGPVVDRRSFSQWIQQFQVRRLARPRHPPSA
jgi:transposase-like protein